MKIVRSICCCLLLVGSLLAIYPPGIALAQEDEPKPPEEKIEMSVPFPTLEAIAGGIFEFTVELKYTGSEPRIFELRAITPKDWEVFITPQYEKEKRIQSIRLEPEPLRGEKIRIVSGVPIWALPEPGEYKITLEAISGELEASTELTAIITARYDLSMFPAQGRYDTKATAGKDNFFSIKVQNLGTAAIDNIKFSSYKSGGWTVEFTPDKIDSLGAFDEQTIDVNIKPPRKTIAGDYSFTITASGKQASAQEIQVRVTVESPTIWGWVGVIIILIVVVGLIVIFMRFSRR